MIKIIWAFCLTMVNPIGFLPAAFAQVNENFNDGDFTGNPEWQGNASDFSVQAGMLQLQAPHETGQSYLATPSRAIQNAAWEFVVHLAFNPSGQNYARIYLTADKQDLTSPLQGYYVLVGGTSDEVSLYRQDLGSAVKIIDGIDGTTDVSQVDLRVRVTRNRDGHWELYAGSLAEEDLVIQGGATDLTYAASSYFGIFCRYTSTRADGFRFDDITVTGEPQAEPEPGPTYKGVIITEILADPSPAEGLPEVEFIEIHNRTAETFSLAGCTVSDGSATGVFPGVVLEPGAYLVVTAPGESGQFDASVKVVPVAGMPTLNNTGDAIVLRSGSGIIIDSVNYSYTWYGDAARTDGGWTLELIDPEHLCGEEDNWTTSQDPSGGTPGRQNSVFGSKPDQTGPRMIQAIAIDSFRVRIYFNEKLADEPVLPQDIAFDPPVTVTGVSFVDRSLRAVDVMLADGLALRTLYSVAVKRIRDCSRNMVREPAEAIRFAIPEEADSLDVVINEILFNPNPGGVDFVELFNRSPKYINLKNWSVGEYSGEGPEKTKGISTSDLLLKPGDYTVLTPVPDALMNHYPLVPGELIVQTSLPSLPDDAGSVALVNSEGKVIDAVIYTSDWHSAFLSSEDGVSLERVSPDAASLDPQNWNSGSTAVGFASPGMENSSARKEMLMGDNAITIDPPVFHPMSGQADFTLIRYKFDLGGYVANARILDAYGRTIKLIANNDLLGTEGFYSWEGDRDDGSRARVGFYWLWFEVFSSSGRVMTFRERIIIAGDF